LPIKSSLPNLAYSKPEKHKQANTRFSYPSESLHDLPTRLSLFFYLRAPLLEIDFFSQDGWNMLLKLSRIGLCRMIPPKSKAFKFVGKVGGDVRLKGASEDDCSQD
jgi:hypothetical protein